MVGVGATGLLLGDASGGPPRHALLVSAQARVNPFQSPVQLTSGGERIGALLGAYFGYGFLSDFGLSLRVLLGGVSTCETGPTFGLNGTASVGLAF